MYACTCEPGRGFFEGVCRLEERQLTFRDPPRPSIRESTLKGTRLVRGSCHVKNVIAFEIAQHDATAPPATPLFANST